MLLALTIILPAVLVQTAQADKPNHKVKIQKMNVRYANTVVATWKCQDKIPVKRSFAYSPWKPHHSSFWQHHLNKFQLKLNECRAFLKERARQWNWQAFPDWIIRLARCESSINWYAEGSSSDGTFYSAFNIGRSVYDRDAHKMGVRGWHEGPGIPSPYEQAMAVIGHVRIFGDGFTGRCAGIARSSW